MASNTNYPPLNPASLTWNNIANKPLSFPPSAHNHVISDVTSLQTALDDKASSIDLSTHVSNTSDANKPVSTATQTALNGKANTSHTHVISDVTGLQTALDGKAANVIGSPVSRSLSANTAYQATTNTKPAFVTLNLTSTASLTLTAGATNTAQVVIGSTNAVASGTGTVIGQYSNSLTGTLVVGLAINTAAQTPITFALPVGWFFAIRPTSGNVTISSAYDQSLG